MLQLDSGEKAFVFAPGGEKIDYIIVTQGFRTKAEFEANVFEGMPFKEVLEYDPNWYPASLSCVLVIAHYVKEGMFVLTYDKETEGDPVTDIAFYENDKTEDAICELFPYILGIDKA